MRAATEPISCLKSESITSAAIVPRLFNRRKACQTVSMGSPSTGHAGPQRLPRKRLTGNRRIGNARSDPSLEPSVLVSEHCRYSPNDFPTVMQDTPFAFRKGCFLGEILKAGANWNERIVTVYHGQAQRPEAAGGLERVPTVAVKRSEFRSSVSVMVFLVAQAGGVRPTS